MKSVNPPYHAFQELVDLFRNGELEKFKDDDDILTVLKERFEHETAQRIWKDILYIKKTPTDCWKPLYEEAHKKGYRKGTSIDIVDWEAVLNAPFDDIIGCIKSRGEQSKIAFRILVL